MLHLPLYCHHIIGIILITISVITKSITNGSIKWNFYDQILMIVVTFCIALQTVIEKYIIDMQFVNGYLLVGGEGIIGLILSVLMLIILNEKECPIDANYCNEGKTIDSFIDAINTIVSDYIVWYHVFIYYAYSDIICQEFL